MITDLVSMTSPHHMHVPWLGVQCVLLLITSMIMTSQCTPVHDIIDGNVQDERWLSDESFYGFDNIEDTLQADGRDLTSNDLCPPVPRRLPVGGCDVQPCSSDRECANKQYKCCYNGCVYTCLPEVKPPSYFDWIREPMRQHQFGQSWLIAGPKLQLDAELCSTTPALDDSDPLLCPHGYECSIDVAGRPAEGIPNIGHCVKVVEDVSFASMLFGENFNQVHTTPEENVADLKEDSASMHACRLEEQKIILSGHSVIIGGRSCFCQQTRLTCEDLLASHNT